MKVGERYHYVSRGNYDDLVVEIIEYDSIKSVLISILQIHHGDWTLGPRHVRWTAECGTWTYLEGQDKPRDESI